MPSRIRTTSRYILGTLLVSGMAGCPADVAPTGSLPAPTITKKTEATEADPRVERDGEDLYPVKTVERAQAATRAPASGGVGSGRPDESNGMCRLYAPRLPEPQCCHNTAGFDAQFVQETCGFDVYLGESFDKTCGHYFASAEGKKSSFRLSQVATDTVASAVESHYRQPVMKKAPKPDDLGIPGVVRSRFGGWNWAFFAGWGTVRMLTWRDGVCADDKVKLVVEKLLTAAKPVKGAPRPLVPKPEYTAAG